MKLDDVVFTRLGGLKVACVDRQQLVDVVVTKVEEHRRAPRGEPMLVFSANGHSVSLVNSDPEIEALFAEADLVHADGQSVVTLSRFFSARPIPMRSATTDMIHDIPRLAGGTLRHFLLGATADVIERCADILATRYGNFEIAGTQHGYYDRAGEAELVERINAARPDVLWIGLGKPEEQRFAVRNRALLDVPVLVTCGGCYNYVTGDYTRAPGGLQKLGLEWLHRMLTNPRKLMWRYMSTNPHAVYCVVKHWLQAGRPAVRVER